MKLYKWLKNLFYRAPEGFEEVTKNAIKRVKESQKTPESDPLIESCGKAIADIIVNDGWPSKGSTTKIYLTDGTVLVIDSIAGKNEYNGKLCVNTTVILNRYTIEKKDNLYKRNEMVYKEVSL